jgi:hypothetical protein
MAEWLKRPTHNWRIRRFNSYWMHANAPISLLLFSYVIIGTVRTSILIETRTHREENIFMEGIKYAVFTDKSILFGYWGKINILLMSNQDQLGRK